MATLTTSYQKIAEADLGSISGYDHLYLRLYAKYNSQSTENNNTVVQRQLRIYNSGYQAYSGNCYAYLDSDTVVNNQSLTFVQGAEITLGTKTSTVNHSSDGKGSIHITGSFNCYAGTNGNVDAWCDLPTINRKAKINSFSGNDINSTFNVTYTKYTNSFTYKLRISIPNVTELETISSYSSGTAINLSATSLNKIYTNVTNAKTVKIGAVIETWNGSTKIGESSEIVNVCNISNSLPEIGNITYRDTNSNVVEVTGNNQIILQNESTIQFNLAKLTANNNATLVSIAVQVGDSTTTLNLSGTSQENKTLYFGRTSLSENATALFTLTDSRGFTVTKSINITINPYSNIKISSFNLDRTTQISDTITGKLSGTFYNNNIGNTANILKFYYRYKEADADDWRESEIITVETQSDEYSIEFSFSGLSYDKAYNFEFILSDKLNEVVLKKNIKKSIPVMDWGEDDVEFNYEVYKQGGEIFGAKVLYEDTNIWGGTRDDIRYDEDDYKYIEIFYANKYNSSSSVKIAMIDTGFDLKTATLQVIYVNDGKLIIEFETVGVTNYGISRDNDHCYSYNSGDSSLTQGSYIYIKKVIGYK